MTDEEYNIWREYIPEADYSVVSNIVIEYEKVRLREEKEKVKKLIQNLLLNLEVNSIYFLF